MNMHTQLDIEQATIKFRDKKRHWWLLGLIRQDENFMSTILPVGAGLCLVVAR